jgi:hypothetical protein
LYWDEGAQDLGVGEGSAIDFGHQLVGDGAPVFNCRIVSQKAFSADTSRSTNLLFYASDGNSTSGRLMLSLQSTGIPLARNNTADAMERILTESDLFDSGSFSATLQGFSGTAPTATINWRRRGNRVTLYVTTTASGTSNSTGFNTSGTPIPAALRPAADRAPRSTAPRARKDPPSWTPPR